MRQITTLLVFGFACASLFITQKIGLAQSSQSIPNVDAALQTIREVYGISVGFENGLDDPGNGSPVTLDLSGRDIAGVFNALVRQRPGYAWSMQDGVYDLYPSREADSLSQLTIANFVVIDSELQPTKAAVFNLPEVKEWLSRHRAVVNRLINSTAAVSPKDAPNRGPKKISLTLTNVQLRSILNQVMTTFGAQQWIISHAAAGGQKYVSIDF